MNKLLLRHINQKQKWNMHINTNPHLLIKNETDKDNKASFITKYIQKRDASN